MTRLRNSLFFAAAAVSIFLLVIISPGAYAADGSYAGASSLARVRQIPAEIIFMHSCDAVFLIETFDIDGKSIRTGSGFFISDTGFAATVLHVFDNAASATVTLYNGDVYQMRGIHGFSEEFNVAIISVDSEENAWNHLTLADSDLIEAGNTVYTVGNPLGYANTMTAGIIAHTKREFEGETLIQFTAPISFGSGGSPLLDVCGQVVGLASSSFSYGQNLNLAVPINHVKAIEPGELIALPLDRE